MTLSANPADGRQNCSADLNACSMVPQTCSSTRRSRRHFRKAVGVPPRVREIEIDTYDGACMSVYIDDAFAAGDWGRWSGGGHLQADTTAELHSFAGRLGLRREWFQTKPGRAEKDHYDLTRSLRAQAIAFGAVAESVGEGTQRRRGIRRALREPQAGAEAQVAATGVGDRAARTDADVPDSGRAASAAAVVRASLPADAGSDAPASPSSDSSRPQADSVPRRTSRA